MARKSFSAADMLSQGRTRTTQRSNQEHNVLTSQQRDEKEAARYKRVTVYMTEEQHAWARSVALGAMQDGISLSVSDVVRFGLEQLRAEGNGDKLQTELIAQAWREVEAYPGRAKRGLPPRS